MWSRRTAQESEIKKDQGGGGKKQAAAAKATTAAPYGKASAALRKIRVRRRINAAAAAAAKPAATAAGAERCDGIQRHQFTLGRAAALEPIAEEVAASTMGTRSLSGDSSSQVTETDVHAMCSSQSSAELAELSTAEAFADQVPTSSTTVMSRSAQATAGSTSGSSSLPRLPSVHLERISVAPMTPSGESVAFSLNPSSDRPLPVDQPLSSSRSFSLSIDNNFLMEDPVIRDFLGDCSIDGGFNSRSCAASVSFAVPTHDTDELPTESARYREDLKDIQLCTAEEREWLSGGSFASNNAAWNGNSSGGRGGSSTITPLKSSADAASAKISNVTASPVSSAIRQQLLARSSSTTEIQDSSSSSAESVAVERWRERPRFQFTARYPSLSTEPTVASRSNYSRSQQQQSAESRLDRGSFQRQQQLGADTPTDVALILEVQRGGRQSNSFTSNSSLSQPQTSTPTSPGRSDRQLQDSSDSSKVELEVAPGASGLGLDQSAQSATSAQSALSAQSATSAQSDSSATPMSLAAREAAAAAAAAAAQAGGGDAKDRLKNRQYEELQRPPGYSQPSGGIGAKAGPDGAKAAEATASQALQDSYFRDGDRLPADLPQASRQALDCGGAVAANLGCVCGSPVGGHRLSSDCLRQLMRLCTPGCGGSGCGGRGCNSGGCGSGGCGGGGCSGGCGGRSCCSQHHQPACCSSSHCRHQPAPSGCGCGHGRGGCGTSSCCSSSRCCCCCCCCCCSNSGCGGGAVGFRNCCSSSSGYGSGCCRCCCRCLGYPQSCCLPYQFQYQPCEVLGQQPSNQPQQQQQQPDQLQSINCYSKFAPSWAANSGSGGSGWLSRSKAAAAAAASAFSWRPERGDTATAADIAAEKLVRVEKP
ncbi:hypothetical protein BOX15_Mlig024200g1 [Macrostomum lignano]|uniref:Uncharacterized protein n=2 Tax=Macrostomum lignano TaxID=282301 RepID=A0A267GQI9_9PLAT|nr:hypothetical protein BOX15_Mlig024200g1 [Macrostomum lignano]